MALSEDLNYLMNSLSCVSHNGAQHSLIQIEEKAPSAQLKKINLKAGNGDWFCFSPDEGRKCSRLEQGSKLVLMSPLLTVNSKFEHHRACDAVIFIRENNKLTIIYIDLKSGNPTGYSSQFKSSRQFVRYLIGLYEEFTGQTLSIANERYVIFHTNKKFLAKKTTISKSNKIGITAPDNPHKQPALNGDTFYLKELLI